MSEVKAIALLTVLVAAASSNAQSRVDLLRRTAVFYNGFQTVEISGEVTQAPPGKPWKLVYPAKAWRTQPNFIPVEAKTKPPGWVISFDRFRVIKPASSSVGPDSQSWTFRTVSVGLFGQVADRLLNAQLIGTETIFYNGKAHACEIIEAVYDQSPDFKPGTKSKRSRFYVDPETLWILKQVESDPSAGEAIFVVNAMKFDQPPSSEQIETLKRFDDQQKQRSNPAWIGRSLPKITLSDLSGKQVSLAELQGKPVLVDFWASWCGSCNRASHLAESLGQTYAKAGLQIVTITPDTAEDARAWLAFHHLSLPALLDPEAVAWKAFDLKGVPTAVLFDRQGKAVKYWLGLDDENDVRSTVASALASPAGN